MLAMSACSGFWLSIIYPAATTRPAAAPPGDSPCIRLYMDENAQSVIVETRLTSLRSPNSIRLSFCILWVCLLMRLAYTDNHFAPMGVSMPGVPMLLDDQERFIEVPQRWLLELAILNGRTRSPATWRSYAEALYDWLRTCVTNSWRWEDAIDSQLATHRNNMLANQTAFGRPHSESTINGRLRRVIYFYRWAARNDLLPHRDLVYESVLVSRDAQRELLGHLGMRRQRESPRLLLRDYRRQPRGLSRGEILAIRSQLTSERDRLIMDWGLYTGARLGEIHGLSVDRIPRVQPGFASPFVQLDLHITKGRRRRWLWVPLELVLSDSRRTASRGWFDSECR